MLQDFENNKPLNLYVHIPFCSRKCSYCAFYSVIAPADIRHRYIDALVKEIRKKGSELSGHSVASLYIGGGTPSLLSAEEIQAVFKAVHESFDLDPTIEVTVEANPESLNEKCLDTLKQVGVNRLSIGLQAWQDELLDAMNRPHTQKSFFQSFTAARKTGFKNINIDLLFGYPNQTLSEWLESVTSVIKLQPEHISCYSLEAANRSFLSLQIQQGERSLPTEELDRDMYHAAQYQLKRAGYVHYEISNFGLPDYGCRHTTNFWMHQEYFGFGAGAHSYMNNTHFHHSESITDYCTNPDAVIQDYKLTEDSKKLEWLMLRLRLINGFSSREYASTFRVSVNHDYGEALNHLVRAHLLVKNKEQIYCSAAGIDVYDYVIKVLAS